MHHARGLSLIEVMLAIGIAAAAALCAFLLLGRASISAAIEQEQRQLDVITEQVQGQFAASPSFDGLTTETITASRPHGLRISAGELTSAFQGGIDLSPSTTLVLFDSFDVTYQGLTTRQCMQLVPALMMKASNVLIDGDSLLDSTGRLTGEDALLDACNADDFQASQGAVTFRFLRAAADTAPSVSTPPCTCRPEVEVQSIACPLGQVGQIDQRREGTCTGGTPACPALEWQAWTTTNNTCAPVVVPPPPPPSVLPPASTCTPFTLTRMTPCPSGMTGQVTEQSTSICVAGALVPGPWTLLASTCLVPPSVITPCTPHTETQPGACPAGQGGQIDYQRSNTCVSASGPLITGPWIEVSRSCTASCIVAGNCCTPERFNRIETRPCATGQYGSQVVEQEMATTCAHATATPAPGAWVDMWVASDTCTACPADNIEIEQQWPDASAECPTGYTGTHTWQAEEIRTRSVAYACPSGTTTLPSATIGAWTSWTPTGARRSEVNNCTTGTPPVTTCTGPDTDTQWVFRSGACPSGHTGTHTWEVQQIRSRVCLAGTWDAWGMWSDTAAIRNDVNTCVGPSLPAPVTIGPFNMQGHQGSASITVFVGPAGMSVYAATTNASGGSACTGFMDNTTCTTEVPITWPSGNASDYEARLVVGGGDLTNTGSSGSCPNYASSYTFNAGPTPPNQWFTVGSPVWRARNATQSGPGCGGWWSHYGSVTVEIRSKANPAQTTSVSFDMTLSSKGS